MDDNSNTVLMIIVGVCILGLIVILFSGKLPDLVGAASEEVTGYFQTM